MYKLACLLLGVLVGHTSFQALHAEPLQGGNCVCTANTPKPSGTPFCCMLAVWNRAPYKIHDGSCNNTSCPNPQNCKWDYKFTLLWSGCQGKAWFFIPIIDGQDQPPLPLNPPPAQPQTGPIEVPCDAQYGWRIEEWTLTVNCVVAEAKFTCVDCAAPQ